MMAGHAVHSPSSAHRWLNCPGSVELCAQKGGPADESNVYADEGTFAHDIAAQALARCKPARDFLGVTDGTFTVDEDMADAIQVYLDVVMGMVRESAMAGGGAYHIEVKVAANAYAYGTADAVVVHDSGRVVDVVDLKFGRGVLVKAEDNPQLRIYGAGAIKTLEPEFYNDTEVVRLHIVQPRHPRGGHSVEELTRAELDAWVVEVLEPGIDATLPGRGGDPLDELSLPPLNAGDWCRFCPVKAECPALRNKALTTAAAVFDDVETLTLAKTPPDPSALSIAELGRVLEAAPIVEQWLHAVREHAYTRANSGAKIPGHKLVRKDAHRKWRDEEEAEMMLREMLPDGETPHASPKLLSPAQAEKKLDVLGKALVGAMTTKPSTGTVLVPNSDGRPKVNPGDVFPEL